MSIVPVTGGHLPWLFVRQWNLEKFSGKKKKKRLRKLTGFEPRTVGVPDQTHYHYTTVAIAAEAPIFHDYIDAANNIITIGAIIYPCPSPHPLPCPKPMP